VDPEQKEWGLLLAHSPEVACGYHKRVLCAVGQLLSTNWCWEGGVLGRGACIEGMNDTSVLCISKASA